MSGGVRLDIYGGTVAVDVVDDEPGHVQAKTQKFEGVLVRDPFRDLPYLRKLDDMDGRLVDNVDAKTIPRAPAACSASTSSGAFDSTAE